MSPVFRGVVWVTFFPLSRVPFLVCRGWSFQFPLSSRSRAAWLRETVGKSRLTSTQAPRPMAFSQWHRSSLVPSARVSQPQISLPVFSRNRDMRQRTMIKMAMGMATTRKIPQATGKITSMAAAMAAPVSGFCSAAWTCSPSWEKIAPRRAMSSCMASSFSPAGRAGQRSVCFVGTLSPRGATPGEGTGKTPWRHFPGIISYFAENTSQAPTLAAVSPFGF